MTNTIADLDARWAVFAAAPRGPARVAQVCLRPGVDRREFPSGIELCPRRGAIGDRWENRTWMHLPDGSPDPRVQVAVADARALAFIRSVSGCPHHPGDTLIVDLGLGVVDLPTGARLAVGGAVLEVSDVENDACAKFAARHGADVLAWIRAPHNRPLRLRGLFARVREGGRVQPGDAVVVLSR